MLSLVQFLTSKIFYSKVDEDAIDKPETKEQENLQDLLEQIDDIRQNAVIKEEPQNNLINEEEEGCFYKYGIISLITNDYVLIENKYMCELKNIDVNINDIRVGDKVYYMAYKINKGEELKIRKIVSKSDGQWEDFSVSTDLEWNSVNNNTIEQNTIFEEPSCDEIVERRSISKRKIVGKVESRKGREVILEEGHSVNLDYVSSNFVPMIGDWVQLECSVEIDENSPNLLGEILEIISISPLRSLRKMGKITKYDEINQRGWIEKNIVFIQAVCANGYVPCLGDRVFSVCIESDQGIDKWRALKVTPIEDINSSIETSILRNISNKLPSQEIDELVKNKENIEITNEISVTTDVKTEKKIEIIVKNNGNVKQLLKKFHFHMKKYESQLTLLQPKKDEPRNLNPSEQLVYIINCKARFVGAHYEFVVFEFENFKIGRFIKITVNSLNFNNKPKNIGQNHSNKNYNPKAINLQEEDGNYIRGIKPYKPAKFIKNRPVTWKIPAVLWSAIHTILTEEKNNFESEFLLSERIPVLKQTLNFQNYKQRFNYLLYLEEIAQILEMQRYEMKNATLSRTAEFLKLSVPGLVEKRPSLIIGDRVIINYTNDIHGGTVNYEGYIHKIRSSEIFLKFDPKFHEIYQTDQECTVSFKSSTTVIQRCHTAIETVINKLGEDFLFPKRVIQKESQYNFVESGDELSDQSIERLLFKKKIHWINKKLNKYQKEAVRNILKGLARPLPYVIFGPPGTGKTVTVCESILQILVTMPESRILIATPSNSSANLITERLLDSRLLDPGDLIRLVAHHYLESENLPVRLLPYCVTADISHEGSRAGVNISDPRGCKTNVTLSTILHHRIIVGTCTALGILHNMGSPAGHFTHVIVDEAGQASEPEIMIPLSLAHSDSNTQVVLAGDPKQLGPINQSRFAGYFGLSESFLVRLLQQFPYQKDPIGFASGYDPRLVTKLLMNYRSLPELLSLPNKLFYEAELQSMVDPDNSEEAELLEKLSDQLPKRLGSAPPIIFHGVNGTNLQEEDSPSWFNLEEASQVYIYLLMLYNHGLGPDDIGIITPYAKQVYKIRSIIADMGENIPKVGSVEEFQGQERKVIILSTVRTADDKVKEDVRHALGFVKSPERLNVAITRARALLIIIGNPNLLQNDAYWRSVLEHCSARSSWTGDDYKA